MSADLYQAGITAIESRNKVSASRKARDTAGEAASVAVGQVEQQGIGELMMTGDTLADFVTNSGKTVFERPGVVAAPAVL
jgi:hypothetical protein